MKKSRLQIALVCLLLAGAGLLAMDCMEQSGMRWSRAGAQSVLDLRAVRLNGDWALYQGYLQQRKRPHCPDEALVRPMVPEQPELRCAA